MTTHQPPTATEPTPESVPELQPFNETEIDEIFDRLGEPADDDKQEG